MGNSLPPDLSYYPDSLTDFFNTFDVMPPVIWHREKLTKIRIILSPDEGETETKSE